MGSRGSGGRAGDVLVTFAADLDRFAGTHDARRIAAITARLRNPATVAVLGRQGVGVRTVGAALVARGVPVLSDPDADVRVLVVNEAVRDEERAALAGHPAAVIALAKADVCGVRPDGPLASARTRAAAIAADAGVPTVPVVGLLADVVLSDRDVAALRALTSSHADLGSVDAFVDVAQPVDRQARVRLLSRLDRFGIAHAVTALLRGEDPVTLPAILRAASNVDALAAAVRARLAEVRYRRLSEAAVEMRCMTAGSIDLKLRDVVTLAAMTAAADVLDAAGLSVDRSNDADAHERRAVRWRRHGHGPVSPLHRACSADIVRGSLLLLHDAR